MSLEVEEVIPEEVIDDSKTDADEIRQLIMQPCPFRQNGVDHKIQRRPRTTDQTNVLIYSLSM